MTSRWPIRQRLAAVFTGVMALVLAGVGWVVLAQFAAVSDTAINQTLDSRADQIAAPLIAPPRGTDTATVQIPGGQDSPAQLLDTTNRLIAATPTLAGGTLLTSGELHQARAGPVFLDRDQVAGLPGRVRLMAQPFTVAGHPTVLVVAASLHNRDAAITDLRAELLVGLPIVLLAAAVGGYLLAAAALRPVEAMRSHAAAITGDRPDHLPLPAARDEIHRLA